MKATKEKVEILWTKDYDDFTFYDKNREIDYHHCEKKIQESLLSHGWLKSFPMIVDKNLRIRDGQHRFVIAKKLGIEIPVVIVDNFNDSDMFGINNANKRWTYGDFLHYHMQKGDKNARILYELIKEHKLSTRFVLALAHADLRIVTMADAKFCDVSKAELEEKIRLVNDIADVIKIGSERLKCALITIIEHPQYNHRRFLDKLSYQLDRVHVCTNITAYIKMFQDIYNYRTNDKVIFTRK